MITIKGLCKHYGQLELYSDFDIAFEKHKITAILGASGCGKTTLLRLLAGIEEMDKGHIEGLEGERIAMIFQEDRLIPWLSVYDNIAFVLKSTMEPQEIEKRVKEVLERLHLWAYKDYMPRALSGGMQRRVAIGRAFAYESTCILMDEPFKGLDYELKEGILKDLKMLWKAYPKTILFVTHQVDEAEQLADITYILEGKPITYRQKVDTADVL